MAILKIKSGVAKGAVFALKPGANRIGRAEGNDYRIPDSCISAIHCEVTLDGTGKMFVRDLNSSNGTFIEGRRVELGVLAGGESLRLGDVEMIYDKRWWNDSSASRAEIPAPAAEKNHDGETVIFARGEVEVPFESKH
jgi:pSer/pThr/pTyr-binding forkhead associated (FHA) protein